MNPLPPPLPPRLDHRKPPQRPVRAEVVPERRVQTVEATGKLWKLYMLIGGTLGVVGTGIMFGGAYADSTALVVIALPLMLFGFVFYLAGRMGAWWYHG